MQEYDDEDDFDGGDDNNDDARNTILWKITAMLPNELCFTYLQQCIHTCKYMHTGVGWQTKMSLWTDYFLWYRAKYKYVKVCIWLVPGWPVLCFQYNASNTHKHYIITLVQTLILSEILWICISTSVISRHRYGMRRVNGCAHTSKCFCLSALRCLCIQKL